MGEDKVKAIGGKEKKMMYNGPFCEYNMRWDDVKVTKWLLQPTNLRVFSLLGVLDLGNLLEFEGWF